MGQVIAISMVRNEADIIEHVVRHMLAECDAVLVADNNSDDGTREILESVVDPSFTLTEEERVGYLQADTMNALAGVATDLGAEWIVPFDADEWWYGRHGSIAASLRATAAEVAVVEPMLLIPQPGDPTDPNPFARIRWHRPGRHEQKIAFRPGLGRLAMGNHHLEGWSGAMDSNALGMRTLPYRSLDQAKAKLRWGKYALELTDLDRGLGRHWRELGAMDDAAFAVWWDRYTDRSTLARFVA